MFHLELRQGRNVARAFNLTGEELHSRFLAPHLAGRIVVHQDHEFEPRKTKLTVVEGPELDPGSMGMGRGWANATKAGSDVTDRMIAAARAASARPAGLDELKQRLAGRLDAGPVGLDRIVALADDLLPGHRASARLSLAELAVWELLHEGSTTLQRDGAPVDQPDWQAELLRWPAWSQATTSAISAARSSSVANR